MSCQVSFQDWLKKEYGKGWDELYCKVSDLTLIQYSIEYEVYCHSKNIQPVWAN